MSRSSTGVLGSRLAVAVTSVIVTTVVVAGGIAMASVPNNSVTTAKIRNNSVTSAKIANNTIRGEDIRNGTIQSIDLHPSVRSQYAWVDADNDGATLLFGRGVTAVDRVAVGVYTVTFARPAAGCGVQATSSTEGVTPTPLHIAVDFAGPSPDAPVMVYTVDSDGVPTDFNDLEGFSLMLVC